MPTTTAPEAITASSIRKAEQALLRDLRLRDNDRDRAAASEQMFRVRLLESNLAGVTYVRLAEMTGLSKSRVDQLIRGERERLAAEAKAAKKASKS